ncbi:MAG TPA: OB-fold domain-containing protein [Kofleriaceae bacterium]|nr:OB-fold domain-containing protein [Kofleriaceae bacterium]
MSGEFEAPYRLEYTYQRSTGPVIGRFLGGLRVKRLEGVTTERGAVIAPPLEYDPASGDATKEPIGVGPGGVVTTWAWVDEPKPFHPVQRPFAWALVRLDGADTGMLHAVDVGGDEKDIKTGMRVTPKWREERTGSIRDLECFVPETAKATQGTEEIEPVTVVPSPVALDYTITAGRHLSTYLRALATKRIVGGRCPSCDKVYLPPRGSCPTCGIPAEIEAEVKDTGTITTFCVIRIPFDAAPFPPPYAAVAVLLDGADMPIFHLLRGISPEDVRMGMRVRAVWVDDAQLAPTLASVRWFEPSGEPDVAFEQIARHL